MDHLILIFKEIIYLGVTASILILIILLMKRIFNRALSPKWHYYIWILLLIRLLLPFHPESSISVYNFFYTAAEKVNLPIREIGIPFQGSLSNRNEANIFITFPQTTANDNKKTTTNSKISSFITDTALKVKELQKYDSTIIIMAFIWLIGVLLLGLYTIYINIVFTLNVHKAYTPLKDERIIDILEGCKNKMQIKYPISLLTSKKLRAPSLFGFLNTKILVSEAYMGQLSDEEIKYIFLHELSHYKRKDIVINWIITLLQIVYFFNPLIWYAFYKIHEDCEISCDAAALKHVKDVEYQSYGNTIIKLIKLFSESNFIPATVGILKNKSSYKRRIIMISEFKKSKWTNTLLAITLIITIGLIGLTGCKPSIDKGSDHNTETLSNTDTTEQAQSTAAPTNQTEEAFYGHWVIKQVLAYGQVGTYSSEDAKSLLGKVLSFSADKANCFGDNPSDIDNVAVNPVYKKTTISKSDFIINYRITLEKLGVKADSITEIAVSDSKGHVCTFLIKDDNTLILYGGGTFFELNRQNNQ